jgi:actin-related protein 3
LTGTVIDSGDGITHVFPICDGAVIPSAVQDIPLAGSDITEYIKNELKIRENLSAGDLNEVAQKVKERYGYVCSDLMKEFSRYDEKVKDPSGKDIQQQKWFKKFTHKTLNGNMVSCDVGYERFMGPEMLFHPEFVNKDFKDPLEVKVDTAI